MNNALVKMTSITAGLTVAILLLLFLLIIPTVREVTTLQQNLVHEQQELEARYQQGLLLKRLREDAETIQKERDLLTSALLTTNESVAFITRLEALAGSVGIVHRLTLPLSTSQKKGDAIATPITLEWQGAWIPLLKMLVALEQEPYSLPLDTIRLVASRSGQGSQALLRLREPSGAPKETVPPINATLTGVSLWQQE